VGGVKVQRGSRHRRDLDAAANPKGNGSFDITGSAAHRFGEHSAGTARSCRRVELKIRSRSTSTPSQNHVISLA
jgi:hypothetical protein